MTQQTIGVGTVANDGTGDLLRTAFTKTNSNFTELYNGLGGLVGKSGVSASHTGDALESTLATITIPANAISANGVLRVTSFWSCTGSTNNKTIRHRLGGTVTFSILINGAAVTNARVEATTIAANATNSQNTLSMFPRGTDFLVTEAAVVTTALDMTASQSLTLTGQLVTTSETITLLGYIVEVMQ